MSNSGSGAIRLNYVLGVLIGAVAGAIGNRLTQSGLNGFSLSILPEVAGPIVGMQGSGGLGDPSVGTYRDQITAGLRGNLCADRLASASAIASRVSLTS